MKRGVFILIGQGECNEISNGDDSGLEYLFGLGRGVPAGAIVSTRKYLVEYGLLKARCNLR